MAFNQGDDEQNGVLLRGKPLQKVDNFKYLGSQMKSSRTDFEHRRGLAWGAFTCLTKIWEAKNIPVKLKVNIFKASVLSILLYGCESWIIDGKLESDINVFANTCYRAMLGIKLVDHVTIETILDRVKMPPLINLVRKRQLGWLGHTLRLDDQEPSKIFALYEPKHGRFKQGPRPLNYRSQIVNLISSASDCVSNEHLIEMAKNKKKWNKIIAAYG